METYFITADDFTGSNDTGVQLSRRGFRTKVVLASSAVGYDGVCYVLDTESRNMPEQQAKEKTAAMLCGLDLSRFDCVIKKVDSTLRGNLAQEILETDKAYGSQLLIFMPALPSLGRTTVNAVHMLNGKPIAQTELAQDPRKPVLEDDLIKILSSVYTEPIGHISLENIASGKIDFSSARLWVCDAVTDEDMRAVISAAQAYRKKVLWVGTAAIADNIIASRHRSYPALAVMTSVSEVARQQLHYAESKGLEIIKVDIAAMLRGDTVPDYVAQAVDILGRGTNLAFVSSATYDRAELDASIQAGANKGMNQEEVAEYACSTISAMASSIVDASHISGMFLSGGDTAIHFFRHVGAGGSEILMELSVGIPMMRLSGGRFDGLKVITKAGAFGSTDALPAIMRKLTEI